MKTQFNYEIITSTPIKQRPGRKKKINEQEDLTLLDLSDIELSIDSFLISKFQLTSELVLPEITFEKIKSIDDII